MSFFLGRTGRFVQLFDAFAPAPTSIADRVRGAAADKGEHTPGQRLTLALLLRLLGPGRVSGQVKARSVKTRK